MFARIRTALQARRAARLEAEALVFRFGSRGVAMARTFAQDPSVSEAAGTTIVGWRASPSAATAR